MRFRFEGCEFHPAARRLVVCGVEAVIGGRAFDLLQALVENHERVVSTDELYERVWPGVAVEANNLQVQIWALRKLLGRHIIANVPRRGYRFMATVQCLPDDAPPQGLAANTPAGLEGSAAVAAAGLLHDHRLVTLVGSDPNALRQTLGEVAARLASVQHRPVWQAQAAVLTGSAAGPGAMPPDAARALLEASARLQQLLERVGRRAAVLVLSDGQLAGGLATAVPALLQSAPRLRVLLQAPQAVGWAGEHVVAVPDAPPRPHATRRDGAGAGISLRWRSR